MGICEDCQHFHLIIKEEEWAAPVMPGFGLCDSEKFVEFSKGEKQPTLDGLFYSDSENYQAFLRVGHRFGCIHFKVKDSEK